MIYQKETYAIRGALIEVHKRLGCGFLEKVYQDALEIEFKHLNIPYEREKRITISYRNQIIDHDYIADFVCYGSIIVELKAVSAIEDVHKAQVVNYLHAANMEAGILVNFGETSCHIEHLFNNHRSL